MIAIYYNVNKNNKIICSLQGGAQSQVNHINRNPLKSTFYSINSLKKYIFLHNNLTILLCRNCAEQIKSIYRLRSYICFFYFVEIYVFRYFLKFGSHT